MREREIVVLHNSPVNMTVTTTSQCCGVYTVFRLPFWFCKFKALWSHWAGNMHIVWNMLIELATKDERAHDWNVTLQPNFIIAMVYNTGLATSHVVPVSWFSKVSSSGLKSQQSCKMSVTHQSNLSVSLGISHMGY